MFLLDISSTTLVMLLKMPKIEIANNCRLFFNFFKEVSKKLRIEVFYQKI